MSFAWLLLRLAGLAMVLVLALMAAIWVLERVMPPPFSGYLAVVILGLVAVQVVKRRPRQQATRMLHTYFRARERGADERRARDTLVARWARRPAASQLAARVEAAWTGESEKDRVLGGVVVMLAGAGKVLDPDALAAAHDRVRNRFRIPGWEALPKEFVQELRGRLAAPEFAALDTLAGRYDLFRQRFFRQPAALGVDAARSVEDFARLLASVGNRIAPDAPGDAERAYRLSLALRPEQNLAHAGLALVLERTGRARDAAREARVAIEVLEAYARQAGSQPPGREDISPFATPDRLRAALERVAALG